MDRCWWNLAAGQIMALEKKTLNFGHDPDHDPEEMLSVSRASLVGHLTVRWCLRASATTEQLLRTFGRNRTKIRRLTSVSNKQCRGTERRIAPAEISFNIFLFAGSTISECHSSLLCIRYSELWHIMIFTFIYYTFVSVIDALNTGYSWLTSIVHLRSVHRLYWATRIEIETRGS